MKMVIYKEFVLGKLTAGYDIENNETLVRQWAIAITGPADLSEKGLKKEVEDGIMSVLKKSSEQAAEEAYVAAVACPGDLMAKLTVAWQTFWQRFPVIVDGNMTNIIDEYKDMFSIGIVESVARESGLVLEAVAGTNLAGLYKDIDAQVRGRLGGDGANVISKFLEVQCDLDATRNINLSFKIPREITSVMSDAAKVERNAEKAVEYLAALACKLDDAKSTIVIGGQAVKANIDAFAIKTCNVTQEVALQIQMATERIGGLVEVLPTLSHGGVDMDLGGKIGGLGERLNVAGTRISTEMQNEIQKLKDIQLETARLAVEEAERKRREIEDAAKRAAEETERLRREAEDAARRAAEETERLRREAEDAARRAAEEAARQTQEAADAARRAAEAAAEAARRLAEGLGGGFRL